MKERIKVTDIIDFQRDENDANRYYFGFWTDFDYWEIAFTLKDGKSLIFCYTMKRITTAVTMSRNHSPLTEKQKH